jgi:sec-independent protein translocase protein TatA
VPIGPLEILILVVIVALLFGAKKLPQLGSGLGHGMREFKEGVTGEDREVGPGEPNRSDTAAETDRSGSPSA